MTFTRKRKNKYNAKKTEVDGIMFDSQKEARRYCDLKLLERAGQIKGLNCQPVLPVIINDIRVFKYKADFEYWENGERVIEDVKSEATRKNATYRVKKKTVEALYKIQIREV